MKGLFKKAVAIVSVVTLIAGSGTVAGAATKKTRFTVASKTMTLLVGESKPTKAKIRPKKYETPITFSTSKAGIVQVDAEGVVTALKAGKVVVTAKASDGRTRNVTVTVPEKSLYVDKFNLASMIEKGHVIRKKKQEAEGERIYVLAKKKYNTVKIGSNIVDLGKKQGLKTIVRMNKMTIEDLILRTNRNCFFEITSSDIKNFKMVRTFKNLSTVLEVRRLWRNDNVLLKNTTLDTFKITGNNNDIYVDGSSLGDLEVLGHYDRIYYMNGTASTTTNLLGSYNEVEVDKTSKADSVAVDGDHNKITVQGTVSDIAVSGSNNTLEGSGEVKETTISGDANEVSSIKGTVTVIGGTQDNKINDVIKESGTDQKYQIGTTPGGGGGGTTGPSRASYTYRTKTTIPDNFIVTFEDITPSLSITRNEVLAMFNQGAKTIDETYGEYRLLFTNNVQPDGGSMVGSYSANVEVFYQGSSIGTYDLVGSVVGITTAGYQYEITASWLVGSSVDIIEVTGTYN
ncbi:MAG: Ig-like domain-containing protein [Lachnospiraceae bacterium]